MKIAPIIGYRLNNSKKSNQNFITQTPQKQLSFQGIEPKNARGIFEKFIEFSMHRNPVITRVRKDLEKAIEENNVKEILEYFGRKCKVDENNFVTILGDYSPTLCGRFGLRTHAKSSWGPHFYRLNYDGRQILFKFSDFGIDENKLFKKIIAITDDADFEESGVTNLGELKSIGGEAHFQFSNITNLGKLESIGRQLYLDYTDITNLGKLKSVGGTVSFSNSKVTDLGDLESIGKNAFFYGSNITSLGKLKSIGGDACMRESKIVDFGELKSIGGSLYLPDNPMLTNIGKIESVGRYSATIGFPPQLKEDVERLSTDRTILLDYWSEKENDALLRTDILVCMLLDSVKKELSISNSNKNILKTILETQNIIMKKRTKILTEAPSYANTEKLVEGYNHILNKLSYYCEQLKNQSK